MPVLIGLGLLAFLLIAGPVGASVAGHELGGLTTALLVGSGILLLLIIGTAGVIGKLYQRTKASEAFVKTGMGGSKVVKDGGAIVIPFIHEIVRVTLSTIRLDVSREAGDALLTHDKLRTDVRAEFYIHVKSDEGAISEAARAFGPVMTEASIKKIVEDKLVSALRTVAATKTLEELNSKRDDFLKEVRQLVEDDLKHNGLVLETATISKLDQTDQKSLRQDNIFDAQGLRTIAEITQNQLTQRNLLVRKGEQEREAQDVATKKRVLELQQEQEKAIAEQAAAVTMIKANQEREAQEKQIEARRQVELAEVEKQKQLAVAAEQQKQAKEVADRQRQEAVIAAQRKVEEAERQKLAAIAKAEALKANEEALLAQAEAEREKQRQAIKTVEVVANAERTKQQQVIEAQAAAERQYVTAQRDADAKAYGVHKDAEGRKQAADADAEAVTKRAQAEANAVKVRAEAEAEAAKQRASGHLAEQRVPVQVEAERVTVEGRRVEVLGNELKLREEHGTVAQQFEVQKLAITEQARVLIARAENAAKMFGKVNAQIFGTMDDASGMMGRMMEGKGTAELLEGFIKNAGESTQNLLKKGTQVLEALTGKDLTATDGTTPVVEAKDGTQQHNGQL